MQDIDIRHFRKKVKYGILNCYREPLFSKDKIEIIGEKEITFQSKENTIGKLQWSALTLKELKIIDEYLFDQISKSNLEQLSKKDIDLLIQNSIGWGCVECTMEGKEIEDCKLRKLLLKVGETCSNEK